MADLETGHDPFTGAASEDTGTWALVGNAWAKVPLTQAIPVIDGATSILVYDSVRHREVLASGESWRGRPSGTWEWDGHAWQHIITTQFQWAVQEDSAAYSPELRATVAVASCAGPTGEGEFSTGLFDGTAWRSVSTVHGPGCQLSLAYSPKRHAVLALSLSDWHTWRFDGQDWYPLPLGAVAPPVVPRVFQAPAVALDEKRDEWVVFGGYDGLNAHDEMWLGNGTSWTQRCPQSHPSARAGAGRSFMAWDPRLNELVLVGGLGERGEPNVADTWSWDGTGWTQLAGKVLPAPTPAPRCT